MRKRMCRYIGLSSATLYHWNRSNSKAEWNEALERGLTKYILSKISLQSFSCRNFAFRPRGLIRLRFRDNNIVKGR